VCICGYLLILRATNVPVASWQLALHRGLLMRATIFLNHRFTQIDTDENDQTVEPFSLSGLIGVHLWLLLILFGLTMYQSLAGSRATSWPSIEACVRIVP
jgi:hypothetical protein